MTNPIVALKAVQKKRQHDRILKAAEKRAKRTKWPRRLSNADQVRYLAVVALKTAKQPLSLYQLADAFKDGLQFKIRTEYLLMELLLKRKQTGIILMDDMRFGLRSWGVEALRRAV